MSRIFLGLISTYQSWISPLLAPRCRFEPTCSHYAYNAIKRYGMVKGLGMSVIRIMKCHPFHPGGTDPVK